MFNLVTLDPHRSDPAFPHARPSPALLVTTLLGTVALKVAGCSTYGAEHPPHGDVLRFLPTLVLVGFLLVFASACSSSGTTEQFCQLAEQNSGQVDASYVGSDEHVAAFNDMIAAAPDEVTDELTTIRNHLRDEVTAEDPDSRDIANYPAQVQAAVEFSDQFIASECDVEMAP